MKRFFLICLAGISVCTVFVIGCTRENADPCTSSFLISNIQTINPYPGAANGEIRLTTIPDTGSIMISLNGAPPTTQKVFSGLKSGKYTIRATSPQGCESVRMINLDSVAPCTQQKFSVSIIEQKPALGATTRGSLKVGASGELAGLRFELRIGSLSNPIFRTADAKGVFDSLLANNYIVKAINTYGCEDTTQVTISNIPCVNPATINISYTTANSIVCLTGGTLSITGITGANFQSPYKYSLSGPGINTGFTSQMRYSNLPNGDYSLTALDANGCTSQTRTFKIADAPAGYWFSLTRTAITQTNKCGNATCHGLQGKTRFIFACTIVDYGAKINTVAQSTSLITPYHTNVKALSVNNLTIAERSYIASWIKAGGKYTD